MGVVGGPGAMGSVGSDVVRETFYAQVGQQVVIEAAGDVDQGEGTYEIICRILVRDEEIYVHGDQGSANDAAEVECAGPVYIPEKNADE
jgi:hypothetical protein